MRKEIYKILNSGHSANNIISTISYFIWGYKENIPPCENITKFKALKSQVKKLFIDWDKFRLNYEIRELITNYKEVL